MINSEKSAEYEKFAKENDSGDYIGVLDGKDKFSLREACNKIIHAKEVRLIYERADQYVIESENSKLGQDIWYLTGEIELSGKLKGKEWQSVLNTQPFLETVLGLIKFGYPEHK
jgi:hypothetical protein